jgi:hypothetical protein
MRVAGLNKKTAGTRNVPAARLKQVDETLLIYS